jgi:CubicO group peptidase (beta-lactamase class C family)
MAIAIVAQDFVEATPEEVGMSSERLANVRRLVQSYVDSGILPGAITAVVRRGRVVHFETCGRMDAGANKAMQPDTIFRIASMTNLVRVQGSASFRRWLRRQVPDPAAGPRDDRP